MKITIEKPLYGWTYLTLKNKKQHIINISCSGVFNPFPDITDFINCLTKRKKYTLLVDQEGFDAEIKIIQYNHKGSVLISFCNWKDKKKKGKKDKLYNNNFYHKIIQSRKKIYLWVKIKPFIKELRTKLDLYQLKNKKEAFNEDYPLCFDRKELLYSKKYVKIFDKFKYYCKYPFKNNQY